MIGVPSAAWKTTSSLLDRAIRQHEVQEHMGIIASVGDKDWGQFAYGKERGRHHPKSSRCTHRTGGKSLVGFVDVGQDLSAAVEVDSARFGQRHL